jgi:hypothetical protein
MPPRAVYSELGRRERQLMEIVYRRGRVTAAEILCASLAARNGRISSDMSSRRVHC